MFKIFMLAEYSNADVLCLQETWLPKCDDVVIVPGYAVFEQRRAKGKRGGFAILVRHGISVTRVFSNDYA